MRRCPRRQYAMLLVSRRYSCLFHPLLPPFFSVVYLLPLLFIHLLCFRMKCRSTTSLSATKGPPIESYPSLRYMQRKHWGFPSTRCTPMGDPRCSFHRRSSDPDPILFPARTPPPCRIRLEHITSASALGSHVDFPWHFPWHIPVGRYVPGCFRPALSSPLGNTLPPSVPRLLSCSLVNNPPPDNHLTLSPAATLPICQQLHGRSQLSLLHPPFPSQHSWCFLFSYRIPW